MNNNDVLRQLRFIFNFSNKEMINIFKLGELRVEEEEVVKWMKKEEDPIFLILQDLSLIHI